MVNASLIDKVNSVAIQMEYSDPDWALALKSFATLMVVKDEQLSKAIAETVTDMNQALARKVLLGTLGDVDHG